MWPEAGAHALDFASGRRAARGAVGLPFGLDLLAEAPDAERLDEHLDARLVDVVAPAMAVVHAQDRFEVGEELRQRQEFADAPAR